MLHAGFAHVAAPLSDQRCACSGEVERLRRAGVNEDSRTNLDSGARLGSLAWNPETKLYYSSSSGLETLQPENRNREYFEAKSKASTVPTCRREIAAIRTLRLRNHTRSHKNTFIMLTIAELAPEGTQHTTIQNMSVSIVSSYYICWYSIYSCPILSTICWVFARLRMLVSQPKTCCVRSVPQRSSQSQGDQHSSSVRQRF